LALFVCAVGIAGLVHDSWPSVVPRSSINLHAVFGLLLWIMVLTQFHQRASLSNLLHGADMHAVCRQLSRAVYLLLYVLFGVNQLIRAGVVLWNSGMHGASKPAILQPPENLRDYLAYGIVALITIHALAALQRHLLKRTPQSRSPSVWNTQQAPGHHFSPTTSTTNDPGISAGRG
jgi:cytochrome b561